MTDDNIRWEDPLPEPTGFRSSVKALYAQLDDAARHALTGRFVGIGGMGSDHASLIIVYAEVTTTNPDKLRPISWIYASHFHDCFFHLPGSLYFPKSGKANSLVIKWDMITGSFSNASRHWGADSIIRLGETWAAPNIDEEMADRLRRHGIHKWEIGYDTDGQLRLFLASESDFMMARMLL